MSHLLKPLETARLKLLNRLVMPPMATEKADQNGKVTEELIEHYNNKSKGGCIGLVIVEHSFISPEGKASPGQLSVADDSVVEGLKKLAEVIRSNGSKAVLQINHAGSAASEKVTGTTPAGPSAVTNPRKKTEARELTGIEIENIITAFGNAARRVKLAGFDGVEIHSAHGFLLNQFFSPLTNKRTDQYGGALNKRMTIHYRVIEAVRKAVDEDFPILLRLGASDYMEGGTTIEESKIAAEELAKLGIEILDISGGHSGYTVPGLSGQGFFAPLSEAIKEVVKVPVILTGGVTDAHSAEKLLAENKADLIGVGRAIYKDDDWARRALESLSKE
ncbi:MAG: NADH:flavin oxidoreductase [Bacillota bacterium]